MTVTPIAPFAWALHQLQQAGRPEWRAHTIAAVLRELRAGRNGMAVANGLREYRNDTANSAKGGAA